jgi:hypothetical protein
LSESQRGWSANVRHGPSEYTGSAVRLAVRSSLRAQRERLLQREGLGERRGGLEPLKDLATLLQDGRGLGRSGEPEEAPAPAERRERLLTDHPEPLSAISVIAAGIGSGVQVPSDLGESGPNRVGYGCGPQSKVTTLTHIRLMRVLWLPSGRIFHIAYLLVASFW